MIKIVKILTGILLVALVVVAIIYKTKQPSNALDIQDSFFSKQSVEPIYEEFTKYSDYISLNDGTQIAVDYFVPKNGPKADSFPVIFEYTPYGRSYFLPDMPLWQQVYSKIVSGISGPVYDRTAFKSTRILLSQGYAYVVADMRGTGASSGVQLPLWPKLGDDGKEIINWITQQNWSNGKVGMTGQSFVGWSQFITASRQPKGLLAIAPSCILFESYTEGSYPGGILSKRWLSGYSKILEGVHSNKNDLNDPNWRYLPSTPVVDEDGDGQLIDELPLRSKGDPTVFTDDMPFTYADGNKRRNIYANNTLEHLGNLSVDQMAQASSGYIDYRTEFQGEEVNFMEISPGSFISEIENAGIAVYNLGGWFDGFTKGSTKSFSSLYGKVPDYLMIAPRFHIPQDVAAPYKEHLNYKGNFADQLIVEQLAFYNKHLKNQTETGFEQPVKIYTINKGWERFDAWPPSNKSKTFYFNQDHRLSEKVTKLGVTEYNVDYSASSNYGSNNWNRWLLWKSPDMIMERSLQDQKTLLFETENLEENTQVTGHPIVDIFMSSNQKNADVYVYLSDVSPNGDVRYVSEGRLRSDFHQLTNPSDQVKGHPAILPVLPWHGYTKETEDVDALADEKVVEMLFDLMPVSWLFEKGHKIRISIAGADLDNFELHPALCQETKDSCPETLWNIHSTAEFASKIQLPIVL